MFSSPLNLYLLILLRLILFVHRVFNCMQSQLVAFLVLSYGGQCSIVDWVPQLVSEALSSDPCQATY